MNLYENTNEESLVVQVGKRYGLVIILLKLGRTDKSVFTLSQRRTLKHRVWNDNYIQENNGNQGSQYLSSKG